MGFYLLKLHLTVGFDREGRGRFRDSKLDFHLFAYSYLFPEL